MAVLFQDRIYKYLLQRKNEMLDLLGHLVLFETPTAVPSSQDAIFSFLEMEFQALDFYTSRIPGRNTGGILYARPAKRKHGHPIQLLVGHCDTVWPENTLKTMPLEHIDGKLKGPGVYDMKAGIVQIIYALRAVKALNLDWVNTPVILLNSDEEKGSSESTVYIRRLARIAERAFVLEPPLGLDGALKTARKGLGRFTIEITGIPAHAGLDPEKGASAIRELSHQVQALFALNDFDKGISVNVGMIEGGTNPNVVAPFAKAVVDVRVQTIEDQAIITDRIHALKTVDPETSIEIKGRWGRPPMERTERNQKLWLMAQKVGQNLGIALDQGMAGGGSDGNTTSLYTATLDGLGTVGDGAHAHHEFIFTDKLVERCTLLSHLILHKGL